MLLRTFPGKRCKPKRVMGRNLKVNFSLFYYVYQLQRDGVPLARLLRVGSQHVQSDTRRDHGAMRALALVSGRAHPPRCH